MRNRTTTRTAAVLLAVSVLGAGCADSGSDAGAASGDSADEGGAGDDAPDAGGEGTRPVVDPACPDGLTAKQLDGAVDYPDADVDGDGRDDAISIGSVTGAGGACSAALVVTTATGTAVAALPDLALVPPRSVVPGAAATIGEQTVVAAPISFSPRGGGEVGLFTLVDGALVPVETPDGEPWAILSTVDDGGGVPQSIDCAGAALVHRTVTSDPLAGETEVAETRWTIDGAVATRAGASRDRVSAPQGAGDSGLDIFTHC